MAPTYVSEESPRSNAAQAHFPEPIAICGTSVRLPGGVDSPEELWEAIMAKRQVTISWPHEQHLA